MRVPFVRCLGLLLTGVAVTSLIAAPAAIAAPRDESDAARLRRAEAMATEAKALFQNRVYLDAARLFMEAFAISRRAPLVYNAARAYEEGGQLKRAESLFLLYLSLPDADEAGKGDATEHLQLVRERLRVAEPVAEPPPSVKPEPTPVRASAPPPQRPRWPWIGAGVGLVAAGSLYTVARLQADALDVRDVVDSDSRDAYAARRDRASALRWAAVGCAVVAGGFAAYGAVTTSRPPSTALRLTPLLGPTRGLALVGGF